MLRSARLLPLITAALLSACGSGGDQTTDAGAPAADASTALDAGPGDAGDTPLDAGSEVDAGVESICGDGEATGDEICDDTVNDGTYGHCMPGCKAFGPFCGDGTKNGDERCDDTTNDGAYGHCMPGCAALGPFCGDGAVNGTEICDDALNDGTYGHCNPGCAARAAYCGDGEVNGDEGCDDRVNDGTYDHCASDCSAVAHFCGDEAVDETESCDDGVNDGSYGHCLEDCSGQGPRCGDTVVNGTETCDDGVNDGSPGHCLLDCTVNPVRLPHCGDSLVEGDERCDDGVNDGTWGHCATGCTGPGPSCGDGLVNGPEVCDSVLNGGEYGGCMTGCTARAPYCGDRHVDPQEGCDDGRNDGTYGSCTTDCATAIGCGDGLVNGREVCDDGVNDGRYGGCVAGCTALAPRCGDGTKNGTEACDDGTNTGGYGKCAPGCVLGPRCGDSIVNGTEACDRGVGNTGSYNGCTATCTRGPYCGDGVTQAGNEECDDGDFVDTNACSNRCRSTSCTDRVKNGDETGVDCGGASCRPCTKPTIVSVDFGAQPVALDQAVTITFNQKMKASTFNSANIQVAAGSTIAPLRFIPGVDGVKLETPHWLPSTTYTLTVRSKVADAWDQEMGGTFTRTFDTGTTYGDGEPQFLARPLAHQPNALASAAAAAGEYDAVSSPEEFVVIGANWVANKGASIVDPVAFNGFSGAVTNPIWSSADGSLDAGWTRRARRGHLDADVRDEIAVVSRKAPDLGTITIINPTPKTSGVGTDYTTKVLTQKVGVTGVQAVFDIATGQFDSDVAEEIFVLAGGGMNTASNTKDGKLRLYVFDDAANNFATLRNGDVLATLAGPIAAVSLDVGDLDHDGVDEIVVGANVYEGVGQRHVARVVKRASNTLTGADLPLASAFQPTQQRGGLVDLLKVEIANVNEDPSKSEIIVGYVAGNAGVGPHAIFEVFSYTSGNTPTTAQLLMHDLQLTIPNETFTGHPDRLFLSLEADGDVQRELLLPDGTVRRMTKSGARSVLSTLVATPASLQTGAADKDSMYAIGSVQRLLTGNPLKGQQILTLSSKGITVTAIDPPAAGQTAYRVRALTSADQLKTGYTLPAESLLVTADVDHDGIFARYAGQRTGLSNTHILSAVAAPPCTTTIGQNYEACVSSFGSSTSNTQTDTVLVTTTQTVSVGFLLEISEVVALGAGVGVTAFSLSGEVATTASEGFSFSKSTTLTSGSLVATGYDQDLVTFSTVPYDLYDYTILGHYDPAFIGKTMTIAVPLKPRISTTTLDFYEAGLAPGDYSLRGSVPVFTHTPGVLGSYTRESQYGTWAAGREVLLKSARFTSPQGGHSTVTATLGLATASSEAITAGLDISASIDLCVTGVCGGVGASAGVSYGFSTETSKELTFNGTVGGLDAATFPTSSYTFTLTGRREKVKSPAGKVVQDFLVLDYLVTPH